MKRIQILFATLCMSFLGCLQLSAQEEIRLYEGMAPGSENWKNEEITVKERGLALNVINPTLAAYPAENPNGIAMVICPGGAFHMLSMDYEGERLAKDLNKRGITCFVLKYRLCQMEPPKITEIMSKLDSASMDNAAKDVVPLELQDAMTAIKYVRAHATQYKIDPHKVGIEGSSAGGTVSLGTAMNAPDESRPDFAVGTYPWFSPWIGKSAPKTCVPLFIATASDDQSVPVTHSINYYLTWQKAGYPAELHLFKEGKHGFVEQEQNLPVDHWTDLLETWIETLFK